MYYLEVFVIFKMSNAFNCDYIGKVALQTIDSYN